MFFGSFAMRSQFIFTDNQRIEGLVELNYPIKFWHTEVICEVFGRHYGNLIATIMLSNLMMTKKKTICVTKYICTLCYQL